MENRKSFAQKRTKWMNDSAPADSSCLNQVVRELLDDSEVELQTFHCPVTRPLAIFVIPKCGTTSAINWAARMDDDIFKRMRYAGTFLAKSPSEVVFYMAKQIEQDFPNVASLDIKRKLADRMMHRYPAPEAKKMADSFRLLPPAPYCPMCCATGKNRLKVFVARNPFVRIASLFKMKWLDLGDEEQYMHGEQFRFCESWADFRQWVFMVISHRDTRGGFTHFLERFPENDRAEKCVPHPSCAENPGQVCPNICFYRQFHFTGSDVFHIRPVYDMLHDKRYVELVGNVSVLTDDVAVLHLETIEEDMKKIEKRLCEEYHNCDPLPEFPLVFPGHDESPKGKNKCRFDPRRAEYSQFSWKELWSSEKLINAIVTHYSFDFALLGYKKTPFDVMPIGSM